jgi:Na+-transporting methylmalonyl-CoA/oxaloacetate decarboxylase gamma subunit
VKEKTTFKRFDLFSTLAVLGVLMVLLFQSIFIFELYHVEYSKIERYLPAALKPVLAPEPPAAAEEPAPVG